LSSGYQIIYNLQLFYWHFLEILWLFIFLVLYLFLLFIFLNVLCYNRIWNNNYVGCGTILTESQNLWHPIVWELIVLLSLKSLLQDYIFTREPSLSHFLMILGLQVNILHIPLKDQILVYNLMVEELVISLYIHSRIPFVSECFSVLNFYVINFSQMNFFLTNRLRNLLFIISIHLWDLRDINLSPYKNRIIFIRK